MSEPHRLKHDPELRAFLESARGDDEPEALARVEAGLAAVLGGASPAPPASSAGGAGLGAGALKIAGLVAIVAVGAAGYLAYDDPPAAPRRPAAVTAPEEPPPPSTEVEPPRAIAPSPEPQVEAPPDVQPAAPVERAERPRSPRPPRRAASPEPESTPPAPPVSGLAEELDLLARARAAASSDPARALELTEQHRARFGDTGRLGAERERIAARAREALEQTPPPR